MFNTKFNNKFNNTINNKINNKINNNRIDIYLVKHLVFYKIYRFYDLIFKFD